MPPSGGRRYSRFSIEILGCTYKEWLPCEDYVLEKEVKAVAL